jgi:hypothetical protein
MADLAPGVNVDTSPLRGHYRFAPGAKTLDLIGLGSKVLKALTEFQLLSSTIKTRWRHLCKCRSSADIDGMHKLNYLIHQTGTDVAMNLRQEGL